MSLFPRKRGAFLGGHISWEEPASAHWHDKVCNDPDFRDLCADIFYSVIPPKARLVRLFEVRGFKLEDGQWDEETAPLAFIKVIASENAQHFGRKTARAIRLNGNPGAAPRVLGVDADGRPYAWSPTTWK
jgi:hypothetical protein